MIQLNIWKGCHWNERKSTNYVEFAAYKNDQTQVNINLNYVEFAAYKNDQTQVNINL